jgi:hypothetical protein
LRERETGSIKTVKRKKEREATSSEEQLLIPAGFRVDEQK